MYIYIYITTTTTTVYHYTVSHRGYPIIKWSAMFVLYLKSVPVM